MDSRIKDVFLINSYLTKCKLEDPDSEKTEMTRRLLTCRVRKLLSDRSKIHYPCYPEDIKKPKQNFFYFLLSLIF
jgi:hypothetical protein